MRQFFSIARATALEMASEPLALLLTLSAMALAVLAPIMHYHQFGEASRMARDAGLSALLVFGIAYAVFCTVKSVRREIDSGTLEMALAHPVSRSGFFLAKLTGAALAYLVFAVTVTAVSVTTVNGAEIGGRIAAKVGDVATVFGPSRVCAISAIVVPTVLGAVLNRFARFRFTLTATVLATRAPVVIAPAMNTGMWESPVTQENIAALKARGVTVVEPTDGELACGVKGKGRMMDPEQIFQVCSDMR